MILKKLIQDFEPPAAPAATDPEGVVMGLDDDEEEERDTPAPAPAMEGEAAALAAPDPEAVVMGFNEPAAENISFN